MTTPYSAPPRPVERALHLGGGVGKDVPVEQGAEQLTPRTLIAFHDQHPQVRHGCTDFK
jgi:hypothetical protein